MADSPSRALGEKTLWRPRAWGAYLKRRTALPRDLPNSSRAENPPDSPGRATPRGSGQWLSWPGQGGQCSSLMRNFGWNMGLMTIG